MSLLVTKEGLLTTVQDSGRFGYRSYGVNPNGPMDRTAVRLLNQLLGNDSDAPVLELYFPAGEYIFESETVFAVGGADFSPKLSGAEIETWATYRASRGEPLKFAKKRFGNCAYLAVCGGFDINTWLGSASTNLVVGKGGVDGRKLCSGDRVPFRSVTENSGSLGRKIGRSLVPSYSASPVIKVTAGPEYDVLTGLSQDTLFGEKFTVSVQSDRMGFRLHGSPLFRLSETEILSSGTTFGTIQLLPDGQTIVLMADHQTTGGYPRIANIASVDLPLMAQMSPGDTVSFDLIGLDEAESLALRFEKDFSFFQTGINVRKGRV